MQENETARGPDNNPLADHWAVFRSWHGEAAFWREFYVRTMATLAAAGGVYVVAALAGLVTTKPLAVVGILIIAMTTPILIYWCADMLVHWKDLRMSKDWSHTPPRNDAERRIRGVYTKALPVEAIWVIGAAMVVAAVVVG